MTGSSDDGVPRGGDGDDLDSLVVQAPSQAQGAASTDDDIIDLRALTKLSASTRPAAAETGDAPDRVGSFAATAATTATPSMLRADDDVPYVPVSRGSSFVWLVPLLIGFLAGLPAGALFFGDHAASRPEASTPASQASAIALAAPSEATQLGAAAAAAAPDVGEPRATGTTARVAERTLPDAPAQAVRPEPAAAVAAPRVASASTNPGMPLAVGTHAAPSSSPAPSPSAAAAPAAASGSAGPQPAPVLSVVPADPIEQAFPEVKQTAAAPEGAPKTVEALLDDALAASGRPQLQVAEARAPEPAVTALAPSRQDVTDALAVLVPAIRGCAMGQAGLATAGIVVQSDGKVASVHVTGAPFEGASSGRCMEGVVRRARFPRFRQPMFRVQFPFAIE